MRRTRVYDARRVARASSALAEDNTHICVLVLAVRGQQCVVYMVRGPVLTLADMAMAPALLLLLLMTLHAEH